MTKESIIKEFENQGYQLNDSYQLIINDSVFELLNVIEPWYDGSIEKTFGDMTNRMDEKTLVAQLINLMNGD